jgi:LysR family hydrogen peroxide-inducible transcriptional activator
VLQLVAAGQGVTLIPRIAIDVGLFRDPRLTLVRFAEPEPSRVIGVAWRKSSPRARDFRTLAELIRGCAPGPVALAATGPASL